MKYGGYISFQNIISCIILKQKQKEKKKRRGVNWNREKNEGARL